MRGSCSRSESGARARRHCCLRTPSALPTRPGTLAIIISDSSRSRYHDIKNHDLHHRAPDDADADADADADDADDADDDDDDDDDD
eukprot:453345-Rhodomonas_salina.3